MLVATVSTSQVQCLASLLIRKKERKSKATIQRLLDRSKDPARIVVVWAAINFHNIALHHAIKEITRWNDSQVYEYLVQIQWASPRRDLDFIEYERDCAKQGPTKSKVTWVGVRTPIHLDRRKDRMGRTERIDPE